jgi:hypothetical protein
VAKDSLKTPDNPNLPKPPPPRTLIRQAQTRRLRIVRINEIQKDAQNGLQSLTFAVALTKLKIQTKCQEERIRGGQKASDFLVL